MTESIERTIAERCAAAQPSQPFTEGVEAVLSHIETIGGGIDDDFAPAVECDVTHAAPVAVNRLATPTATSVHIPADTNRPVSPAGARRPSRPGQAARILHPFRSSRALRIAAAAALVTVGIGGTAFAAERLGLSLWQTDAHQVQLAPPANGDAYPIGAADEQTIEEYRLNFSHLPADLTERNMGIDSGCIQSEGYEGWSQFAPSIDYYTFYVDTDEAAPLSSIAKSELIEVNGHEAAWLEFDFGIRESRRQTQLRLYVFFPDEQRIVRLQTADESLRDELLATAQGLSLEPTGDTTPIDLRPLWSDEIAGASYDVESVAERSQSEAVDPLGALSGITLTDKQMGPFRTVGQSFSLPANEAVSVRVDTVRLLDDASSVSRDNMPYGWRSFIEGDGALKADTISFVKFGDGQSATDTLIRQESSPLKLLEVEVTFTNDSPMAQHDIPCVVYFESVLHERGTWSQYRRVLECPGADEAQNSLHINEKRCSAMEVIDGNGILGGGDNDSLSALEAGESATLRYQWIVNADEVNNLLLDFDPDSYQDLGDGERGQRFVDIRQKP